MIISNHRRATIQEMAAEIDRRGSVIERLEADLDRAGRALAVLDDDAMQSAYAAVPTDKRDRNTIAIAIRAYLDALKRAA